MITTKGKKILSRWVLGIAPTYATHVAIGCGADPLATGGTQDTGNVGLEQMKFEMCRVPILTRGVITEDDVDYMVFSADLPIENRYNISEVSIWSGGRNLRAAQWDSKALASFDAEQEAWYLTTDTLAVTAIDLINTTLSPSASPGVADIHLINSAGTEVKVAGVACDNDVFVNYSDRNDRKEYPRYLNDCIVVRGDYTDLIYDGDWTATAANAIETSSVGANMSNNSPDDEIRFAFTLMSKDLTSLTLPDKVNLWFELVNNYSTATKKYAIAKVTITGTEFSDSRYYVKTFKLSDFVLDDGFSWAAVNGIRIRSSVQVSNAASSDYFLVYDGVRLENVTSENPLYGQVAYAQVETSDGLTLLKTESTNNSVEFRFVVNS